MPSGNERYLFDTSAILAAWRGETGAQDVEQLLQRGIRGDCKIYVSSMVIFEAYYVTKRTNGAVKANEIYYDLHNFPFERVEPGADDLTRAGDLKVKHNLGVADAWIAATAISWDAVLVYKDPDFDPVEELSKLKIGV